MASYRVLIADDHPLFRQGIRSLIEKDSDIEVVGEAGDGFDLLEMIKRVPANLVIMDIAMPRIQGLDATREVKRIFPETAVLILTMHNSKQYLYHAMSAGADGYLLKEDAHDDLVTAIRTIQRGKFYVSPLVADQVTDILVQRSRGEDLARDPLSPREREVLKLVAEETVTSSSMPLTRAMPDDHFVVQGGRNGHDGPKGHRGSPWPGT